MKVHIDNPELQTIFFSILFFLTLVLSLKRANKTSFLDLNITNEVKGLAILTVIFSHLGYFLSDSDKFLFPLSILAGVGVNAFLFISGYGLTVSSLKKPLSAINFYKRRVIKLFIPLWLSLALILFLDKIFLDRVYQFTETWHAHLGFFPKADLYQNINSPLWFITLIIIYYLIFPFIFIKKSPFISGLALLLISYLLFNSDLSANQKLIDIDVFNLYKLHFAAFPLGIIAADTIHLNSYAKTIWSHFKKYAKRFRLFFIILTLTIFTYSAFNSGVGESPLKEQLLSLFTTFSLIILFIFKRVRFGLLSVLGIYSYEIYLLHWPILSRFDLLFKFLPPFLATLVYLGLFILLGYFMQYLSNKILKWYSKLRWQF